MAKRVALVAYAIVDTDDILMQGAFAPSIQVENRRQLAGICYISSAPTPNTVPLQYLIVGNRQSYGSYIGPIQLVGARQSNLRHSSRQPTIHSKSETDNVI